jgi:hypothetical protein
MESIAVERHRLDRSWRCRLTYVDPNTSP